MRDLTPQPPSLPGKGEPELRRNIVIGQRVRAIKVERAKELRQMMTDAERTLWQALRTNRLSGLHFRRQQLIDGFIVDFYCHALGLIVEVDGPIHAQQVGPDAERDRILSARGLRILRLTNEQVRSDLPGVLDQIASFVNLPLPSQGRGSGG